MLGKNIEKSARRATKANNMAAFVKGLSLKGVVTTISNVIKLIHRAIVKIAVSHP
jgi:hypothetical protein